MRRRLGVHAIQILAHSIGSLAEELGGFSLKQEAKNIRDRYPHLDNEKARVGYACCSESLGDRCALFEQTLEEACKDMVRESELFYFHSRGAPEVLGV